MADATKTLQIVFTAKDEATKAIQGFKGQLNGLVSTIKPAAIALAGVGAATGLVAKNLIESAGSVEQYRMAFGTLTGSAEVGKKTLEDLFNFAKTTPFEIPTLLQESKKLLAYGIEAENLNHTLTLLGNVAAGVGMDKLPQLTLAFGQIKAKGRLTGMELRQLTETGFNLAESLGITNKELEEMISRDEISFDDVVRGFENANAEGGKFNNMMQVQAGTTLGRVSNLKDSIFLLSASLGEALLPAVNKIVEALIPAVQAFAGFAKEHENLTVLVIGLGLGLGILGATALVLGPIITGLGAVFAFLSASITFVISIVTSLIAILGGPLTIIIGIIVALVAGLALAWKNNWFDIRGKTETVVNWIKNTAVPYIQNAFENAKEAVRSMAGLFIDKFNSIKNAIQGVIDKINEYINKAKSVVGGVGGNIKGALGFQHGGFIPGGSGDAVPALLHGGERVIPRNGVDVNSGGGGGVSVSINFTGPVSMDDDSRVQELADKIISILGRQNELAAKGVSF